MIRQRKWPGRLSDAAARRGPWVFRAYAVVVAIIAAPIATFLGIGVCAAAAYEEMRETVLPDARFLAAAFIRCIKTGKQA